MLQSSFSFFVSPESKEDEEAVLVVFCSDRSSFGDRYDVAIVIFCSDIKKNRG